MSTDLFKGIKFRLLLMMSTLNVRPTSRTKRAAVDRCWPGAGLTSLSFGQQRCKNYSMNQMLRLVYHCRLGSDGPNLTVLDETREVDIRRYFSVMLVEKGVLTKRVPWNRRIGCNNCSEASER